MMSRFMLLLAVLLAGAVPALAQGPAAAPAAAPTSAPSTAPAAGKPTDVSPAQAKQALDVLTDDKKRADFIATLQTITDHQAAQAPASPIPLAPDSLGARVLVGVSDFMAQVSTQLASGMGTVRSLPSLADWATATFSDPDAQQRLLDAAWRLAVAFAAALAVEWLLKRAIARPAQMLSTRAPAPAFTPAVAAPPPDAPSGQTGDLASDDELVTPKRHRATPWMLLRRLPFVLGYFLLDLVPVIGFGLAAHLIAGSDLGHQRATRLVMLALIDAYVVTRALMCVAHVMFAPRTPRLRLLHISDKIAAYLTRWTRRILAVGIFGYAFAEIGLLFGLSAVAHEALLKCIALVDHVFLCVMVIEMRRKVARSIHAPAGATGFVAAARNGLVAVWHLIALFYIAALWIVWAVEIRDGYTRMLHAFFFTAAVLVGTRVLLILLLGALDRAFRGDADESTRNADLRRRFASYQPAIRATVYAAVAVTGAVLLLQAWGLGAFTWLTKNSLGHAVVSAVLTIVVTVVIAAAVWEAANVGVERHLAHLTLRQQAARSARLRTLLPMMRTALMLVIVVVVGLMVLSQIGINIAPLLAGAGVLGIAVGFGSQKLVQDVITGLFLLLENTMQVGDIVSLGGLAGVVENLSIRAIRLRAEDGSVHVIPFSAVTTVTNMTRDYSHAVIEASVAYKDDYDSVVAVMRNIVAEMRSEARWAGEIQDDLEVWGLNKFADSSVVIKCRIKCGPFGRWAVGREFNRRMKLHFDENGIEIPFPHQRLVFDSDELRAAMALDARGGDDGTRRAPPAAAPHVPEATPEAKLSAEAKQADAKNVADRAAADQELARRDAAE